MKSNIQTLKTIGENFLQEKIGREEANRTAELFLSHLLRLQSPADLFLHREKTLLPQTRKNYFAFLRRRATGEPTQYILGSVQFMDVSLDISPDCLIPRPETELLVEKVTEFITRRGGPMCPPVYSGRHTGRPLQNTVNILDIGTGSGNIAIALAYYLEESRIDAVDTSEKALNLAKQNAIKNNVANQITFKKSFLMDSLQTKYDVIVANLPYLSEKDLQEVAPELHFEPKEALVSGKTGLELIEKTIHDAKKLLKKGGALFLEIGMEQGESVKSLLRESGYKEIMLHQDYAGHDRIVIGVMGHRTDGTHGTNDRHSP